MTLSLIVALMLSARPLTPAELTEAQKTLGELQPIVGQAFEVSELSPDKRYWFIPAQKEGDFKGMLLDSGKSPILSLELDKAARERLVSFDAVAFFDVKRRWPDRRGRGGHREDR